MVENAYKYQIVIKKRNNLFRDKIVVWANTQDLCDIESLIQDKLKKNYFSMVTVDGKVYILSSYEVEKVEVFPL